MSEAKSFPYIDYPVITEDKPMEYVQQCDLTFEEPSDGPQKQEFSHFNSEPKYRSTNSSLRNQLSVFFHPADNQFSRKFFGSKYNLDKEIDGLKEHGRWVIHPYSTFTIIWKMTMVLLLVVNLATVPVMISFRSDDLHAPMYTFNIVFDAIFIFDIVINFGTGIILDEPTMTINLSPKKVIVHYLTTWFVLDLISSIPLNYIYIQGNVDNTMSTLMHAGRTLRIMRIAKIISCLRLLRIFRLARYVLACEQLLQLRHRCVPLINVILLFVTLTHYCTCFQFFVPLITDYSNNCWVNQINILNSPIMDQYLWSLVKAWSNLLGSSFGNYSLITVSDQVASTVTMTIGAMIFAIFVTYVVRLTIFGNLSTEISRYKSQQIKRFMMHRRLPQSLKHKIEYYFHHRFEGYNFDDGTVFCELSDTLKKEIMNFECEKLIRSASLIGRFEGSFMSDIVVNLRLEVLQPGDLFDRVGTVGTKMYFVEDGVVEILSSDGRIVASLESGSNFGELSLLVNSIRLGSARAKTYCRLYSITRDCFLSILQNYPMFQKQIEEMFAGSLMATFQSPIWRDQYSLMKFETCDLQTDKCSLEARMQRILFDTVQKWKSNQMAPSGIPMAKPCGNITVKNIETVL